MALHGSHVPCQVHHLDNAVTSTSQLSLQFNWVTRNETKQYLRDCPTLSHHGGHPSMALHGSHHATISSFISSARSSLRYAARANIDPAANQIFEIFTHLWTHSESTQTLSLKDHSEIS